MTEPKSEKLTRTLNQIIEEYGINQVITALADHCFNESKFLETDHSTDLARNWRRLGEQLEDVLKN